MDIRRIREAKILLPSDDPDHLTPAEQPPARGDIIDLRVQDADWSRLQAEGRAISGCHLTNVLLADTHVSDTRISNTLFDACDLASARWASLKVDRCVFRGSRLIGLQAAGITLADVIFEHCRLDYATLTGLNATGSVAFVDCTLRETAVLDSHLNAAVFADCPMPGAQFVRTTMRGADLRGSTLTTLTGATSLAGATIDESQVPQLTEALLADLQIHVEH
ncbi:pentapeptide repeat-containing protein [Actinomadura roseirufa]|uniref:pentapeptide repeat-containing protein n=1 Tax=Actinomadura roseirufa TaxID=2094049 RepID=UPI00104142CA|nr:pentapeptide repeat-containing protein [Actinomadura roseirufa]